MRNASHQRYATPRAEVEAALLSAASISAQLTSGKPTLEANGHRLKRQISTERPAEIALEEKSPTSPSKQIAVPNVDGSPTAVVRERTETATAHAQALGKGGAQHKIIQQRLKDFAEALGFRATIEKQILEGRGSIDLFLERDGQSFACEISITTTVDHEVGNVTKCLKADLPAVVVVCISSDRLKKIESAVDNCLRKVASDRVKYFLPDGLETFLAHLKPSAPLISSPKPEVRRGYSIKRKYAGLSSEELLSRQAEAVHLMATAARQKSHRK